MQQPPQFGRRGVAAATATPSGYGAPPNAARAVSASSEPATRFISTLLFSFDGRIRRRDFWLARIGLIPVSIFLLWFDFAVIYANGDFAHPSPLAILALPVAIFSLWVGLAVQVKRWHDRDKSWPWVFIEFIPLVGPLWVFVELGCLDGTPGDNRFGPSPKHRLDEVFA
ncbi:MAG: DUF805 domain-containing protein [Caulobacterales bacterium]